MHTLVTAILVFALMILFHELGHFVAAKLSGIKVHEFSIGFGPKLISITHRDTLYAIRVLPLGGYVRMAGMESDDLDDPNGFNRKPVGQRAGVIFAGPFMNFVLALLLFVFTFTVIGIPTLSNSNVIGEVLPGRPAAKAGMMANDRVVAANGQPVTNWDDLVRVVHANPEREITLKVVRQGKEILLKVTPTLEPQAKVGQIGIRQTVTLHRLGFMEGVETGLKQTWALTVAVLSSIVQLITGTAPPGGLAGPVGITHMIGEAAQGGLAYLLNFAGILSINLGLINLLPIPSLDGSRLIFLSVEGIRGKPVEPDKENLIHMIGFALLMVLFLVITYNDILRLFGQTKLS